ncbi:MgtC/SapB family protein [Bacillus sp. HMF5848]|nr:MgtC/SapB family protein [Bacillus sp. HMF5848]
MGTVIGLEREIRQKPAGLKTTMVLTVGSALITIVSIHGADMYSVAYSKPMDPLRLAAQIVSGIGFLGGGVILHRNNDVISGITTAAMIWVSGGLGIAAGAGFYIEAVVALTLMMFSVEIVPRIMSKVGPKILRYKSIKIKLTMNYDNELTNIFNEMRNDNMQITKVSVQQLEQIQQMECVIYVDKNRFMTDICSSIKNMKGVTNVKADEMG